MMTKVKVFFKSRSNFMVKVKRYINYGTQYVKGLVTRRYTCAI